MAVNVWGYIRVEGYELAFNKNTVRQTPQRYFHNFALPIFSWKEGEGIKMKTRIFGIILK